MDKGASASQTGPSQVEPVPVSPLRASVPSAEPLLYAADCMDVLPWLTPVDAVIADLPYGTTQNKWDCALPLGELWAHYRRLAPIAVLTAQGGFTAELICSNRAGFKYKMVWEKSKATNFLNAKKQPLRKHEDICVFGRGPYNPQMQPGKPYDKGVRKDQQTGSYGGFLPARVKSDGERYPTDVIYFPTAESEGTVVHGTQKPLALMRYLVRTFTNPGDTILDNAMGSGTTGVAAILEGRSFIGIESDTAFFAIASDRIAQAIEARRAETLGSACESPVTEGDAPNTTPETPQVQP